MLQPCSYFVNQLKTDTEFFYQKVILMRVEVENEVDEIRQSLELLRRRL